MNHFVTHPLPMFKVLFKDFTFYIQEIVIIVASKKDLSGVWKLRRT